MKKQNNLIEWPKRPNLAEEKVLVPKDINNEDIKIIGAEEIYRAALKEEYRSHQAYKKAQKYVLEVIRKSEKDYDFTKTVAQQPISEEKIDADKMEEKTRQEYTISYYSRKKAEENYVRAIQLGLENESN